MTAPIRPRSRKQAAKTDSLFEAATVVETAAGDLKTVDMSPSEKLKNECIGIRVTFNWFSRSRQVDKEQKQQMADAVGSDEAAFSSSKRLMGANHPLIKKVNELQRRIDGYWKGMTIPLASFAGGSGRPEPGVRLLAVDKIEEVDNRLQTFVPEVAAMSREMTAGRDDILATEKARLKHLFEESDYPTNFDVDLTWGFLSVDAPAALEQLNPALYARAVEAFNRRMDDTYELATSTILGQFLNVVKDWAEVLGPVQRIYPDSRNEHCQYHGAEIRCKLEAGTHALKLTDEEGTPVNRTVEIPENHVGLVIRYYPGSSRKLRETVLAPLTQLQYADLKPSTVASERRTFRTTTIEAMTDFLAQFRNIGTTISASHQLQEMVKGVETQLARLPDAESVAGELRSSATFRNETYAMMTNLSQQLSREITNFTIGRRKIG